MNIHHLELFYYVARYGGITEAVRNIPYGIQQPAVSGQVAQLEEDLGVTLFQRRPFALTPPGRKLFSFIEPFFSNLDQTAAELQKGKVSRIRIGASGIVLRDHLPELLSVVRRRYPDLKVTLREGYQAEVENMLEKEELDLAVTVLEKRVGSSIHAQPLIELPLVLLASSDSSYMSAKELWEKDKITEPLICLPPHEAISKHFQAGLLRTGVDWFTSIEASSLNLIETYVAAGFGIGVSVKMPKTGLPPRLRALELPGFEPVRVGALWRGKCAGLVQVFVNEMQLYAKKLI